MIIATFTSGNKTIVGYTKNEEKDNTIVVDSRILFEDPDNFVDNFIALLTNLFGITSLSKKDKLIFALSGNMDSERQVIVESEIINRISTSKSFDGFSFAKAFGSMVDSKNIFLINDSDCVAMSHIKGNVELPALSIYIDERVGVSIIKKGDRIINYEHSIRPISKLGNKTANYLLCDKGIDDILHEGGGELL